MTVANDEALLRRLVVALAPVPGVEAIAPAVARRGRLVRAHWPMTNFSLTT
jgi:hypothetical protein